MARGSNTGLTFGFAFLTVGTVWILAGSRNQSVVGVLEGALKGPPGPGERPVKYSGGEASPEQALGYEAGREAGKGLGSIITGGKGNKTEGLRIATLKKLIDLYPGLSIGEGPGFGGAAPGVHTATSYHYRGLAYDINADSSSKGERAVLTAIFHLLPKIFPGEIAELFYDPIGYYYDNGQKVSGAIGGHDDHLHVSFYPPK